MYKVVIVDDEPVIRAGLRELLPWEELGMQIVFEAENRAAALDYLHTHRVEILITDIRMEVMDGLELIRQAKALYPQLHCVILTGFDDFAYTKAAIRLGIENYILKPVDEKELLETLSGIENKLMQEEKGETVLDREKQVILQSVLTRWLSGSIEESALRHRANFLDLPLNDAYVQACVLRLLDIRSIAERQAVGMEIIRTWQTAENVRMRVCWENGRDLVLVFSGELAGCGKQLHEQLRQLMRSIEQKRRIKLFAAFGSLQDDPLRLNQSYQDARRVAELSLVLPAGSVMEYRKQYFDDESELVPRIDFEKLEAAIYEGNSEEIISIWSSWKQRVSAATPNPQLVRSYVAETMCRLIVLRSDMLSAEADEWEGRSVLESLYAAGTSAELTAELERYSLSFAERLRQRRSTINPSVRRMVEIVEKQYSRELTIRGMAEQFNANPVYLGRLFKEETGQSFTAFLNQVRIREAKRQLLETDKTVAAIASSVGYLSQGYFTNLFKKSVGCFPREYRLRRR